MDWSRRVTLGVLVFTLATVPAMGQEAGAPPATLTPEQMEAFLSKANVSRVRAAGNGVTGSRRATLSDGAFTHDAHIQVVNEERPVFEAGKRVELNFKDLARYNITGYRLARFLGMDNVPMSVERNYDGKAAAFTWWVDDVKMDEKARLKQKTVGPDPGRTAMQVHIMRVFDALIQNTDRNQGNMLWTSDWKLWLIDHTRAFRVDTRLAKPDNLTRCDRALFERLKGLTEDSLNAAVGKAITQGEIEALLTRRDAIVKHFEARIATRGEEAVLFNLTS
ncbi:MAG TPA: hypothetical protein VIY56_10230 [Vicinamibacterales bacterium]